MNFATIDWECTTLKGDQGILLCGGFKPYGKPPYVITYDDVGFSSDVLEKDRKLAARLRDETEKYDGVITWNGIMFDIPYLRDRLMLCGERMIEKRFHIDIMYQARMGRSTFTSSRLDWVAKALSLPVQKTPLDLRLWKKAYAEVLAQFGNGRENYDHIVKHCKYDLLVTEMVYDKLKNRVQTVSKR